MARGVRAPAGDDAAPEPADPRPCAARPLAAALHRALVRGGAVPPLHGCSTRLRRRAVGLLAARGGAASGRTDPLLLVLVVFGAAYFTRVFGRSDEAHLDSALPPAYLILAHALWRRASLLRLPAPAAHRVRGWPSWPCWTLLLAAPRSCWSERGERPLVFSSGTITPRASAASRSTGSSPRCCSARGPATSCST